MSRSLLLIPLCPERWSRPGARTLPGSRDVAPPPERPQKLLVGLSLCNVQPTAQPYPTSGGRMRRFDSHCDRIASSIGRRHAYLKAVAATPEAALATVGAIIDWRCIDGDRRRARIARARRGGRRRARPGAAREPALQLGARAGARAPASGPPGAALGDGGAQLRRAAPTSSGSSSGCARSRAGSRRRGPHRRGRRRHRPRSAAPRRRRGTVRRAAQARRRRRGG